MSKFLLEIRDLFAPFANDASRRVCRRRPRIVCDRWGKEGRSRGWQNFRFGLRKTNFHSCQHKLLVQLSARHRWVQGRPVTWEHICPCRSGMKFLASSDWWPSWRQSMLAAMWMTIEVGFEADCNRPRMFRMILNWWRTENMRYNIIIIVLHIVICIF